MNLKNSPPFLLDILPDTYQHLRLIYTKYEDKLSVLNSNEYFKIFIENLQKKCKQVRSQISTGETTDIYRWDSFHMVNSVTCMNIGTSLEKAIKRVLNKLLSVNTIRLIVSILLVIIVLDLLCVTRTKKILDVYSEYLKTNHSIYANIWNSDFLKINFWMVKIQEGLLNSPNHLKCRPNSLDFCGKYEMPAILVSYQMVVLLDFRSHLKSGPLAKWALLNHWTYGTQYSLDL